MILDYILCRIVGGFFIKFLDIENNGDVQKVLVLLASYNGEKFIEGQVQSVLIQKDVFVNVIISDDSSTEKTVSVIRGRWGDDGRVGILERRYGSGSAGQNFMGMFRDAVFSDYNYIAFSDQDDIWNNTKLERAILSLKDSSASGYSSSVNAFWPDGKEKILHQSPNVTCADYLFEGAGQGCTFVLTADFFRKVQKFCIENEEVTRNFYYHDWLVYLLSRCWGEKWFFDDQPRMNYRQHGDNDTGARSGYASFKTRIGLIANGWYRQQIGVAIELSKKCGNNSVGVATVENFINNKKTLRQRLSFALFLGRFGRRKFTDRIVLAFSALVGWI